MARSLTSVVSSLFPILPVALVALSVGCGATVVGGGDGEVEDGDGMSCGSVVLEDGTIVKSPLCDPADDGSSDGEDGSDGSDGEDGSDGSDGEDGTEPPQGSRALAYSANWDGDTSSGTTGPTTVTSGSSGGDEDRIVIQIANHDAATCADPYATPEDCTFTVSEVSVSIPADLIVVGTSLALADPSVHVFFSESGGDESGCWGTGSGGGFQEPGTITFDARGQGTLDVAFAGTAYELLEGAHTATLCE